MKLAESPHISRQTYPSHFGGVKPRFAAIVFLTILAIVGKLLMKYEFSLSSILLLLLISAAANLLLIAWLNWGKNLQYLSWFGVTTDLSLITIGIHYLGGIEAPISWVYAVCIMTVALVHGIRMSVYSASLCSLMYSAMLLAESAGILQRVNFGILNPIYLGENNTYLYVKLVSDICFFFITALISGFISEQLIYSKRTLEEQNAQLGLEIAERRRIEEELEKHQEELEELVGERTSALTETIEQLQQEITERRRTEEKLRDSEGKYRLHFENVGDIIFSIDRDLNVTSISPSVESLLGYSPEELVGRPLSELNILPPEDVDKAAADTFRVLSGERIPSKEYQFIAKDGERKLFEVNGDPLLKNGKIVAMVSVARDITEHKELERQLFQAQKMESVGTLAGGIAHDFNNLLSGILGYASLMKAKLKKNDRFFNYTNAIEKSATRAAELTGQLLAFSRGGKYEVRAVNLNNIISDTLEIIGRTFDRSIEIETDLRGHIPTVAADAAQIEQVILNLCINARDAMPDGGKLFLETDVASFDEEYVHTHVGSRPGSYVVLSVTDTGTGMDKETMGKVFEPFFSTKDEGKGTGLGLAMVYGVVKNHGGSVQVYSELGRGSTFKVYLPVDGKPEEKETAEDDAPGNGSETILVVDDEETILSLARDMLETHGYRALLADSGERAIELYKEHNGSIALVIIDMVMPKMGGLETFLQLKRLNSNIKAILSTGYSQNGQAQEILDNGARGFLQKPYQVNALLSKIRSVLDARI
jgi:PAS domain S-box-containing protein